MSLYRFEDKNYSFRVASDKLSFNRISDAGVSSKTVFRIGDDNFLNMDTIDTPILTNTLCHKFYVDSISDERAKDNIRIFTALDKVTQLDVVTYEFNGKSHRPNTTSYGVKAQQLQLVCPELVHKHKNENVLEKDQLLYVDRDGLIGILLQSTKELLARIEVLEAK